MCYEDNLINLRRWARTTPVPGTTMAFPGNAKRVLFRMTITNDATVAGKAGASIGTTNTGTHIICVNGGKPSDEISLAIHGNVVFSPLFVFSDLNLLVTEVFDDSLDGPPVKGDPYTLPGRR